MINEIISLKEAKELRVRTYEICFKGEYQDLMEYSDICLKKDLSPKVLIEFEHNDQLYGKIIFCDKRTHRVYDYIVYDDRSEYIYMINLE